MSGRMRTLVVAAMLASAAVGGALSGGSNARADDAPPTTVPSPTMPAPDPAPPKPKPARKPAAPQATAPPASTPTYRAPRATTFAPPSTTTTKRAGRAAPVKSRPKKVKKVSANRGPSMLPTFSLTPPVAAVRVGNAFATPAGGTVDIGSVLIVLGLGFAIACLAIAVVPATSVKWRPAAIFVSERQVDLMLVGLALLVAAGLTIFLTNRP